MNVCSIWPFAQISDDFYSLGIWQCDRYFVAVLFKELALITIREMWGLESRTSRSRSRLEIRARSRSRRLRSRLHYWYPHERTCTAMRCRFECNLYMNCRSATQRTNWFVADLWRFPGN